MWSNETIAEIKKCRSEWEKGLTEYEVHEDEEGGRVLAILETQYGSYRCHRYFSLGGKCVCSVDLICDSLRPVVRWALDPQAREQVMEYVNQTDREEQRRQAEACNR